jgi:maleylpyruvate isomerase
MTSTERRSLHGYFRSSAAYGVRIALHLKDLSYERIGEHLLRNGGEQQTPEFRRVNPQAQLPALEEIGSTLTQSLAIIEYLDERYPLVALLPEADLEQRARVRHFVLTVACDIHPLNNPRVLKLLVGRYGADEGGKLAWNKILLSACPKEAKEEAPWS